MNAQTLLAVFAGVTVLLALLGWAYQLGRSDARLSRSERDIEEIKKLTADEEKGLRQELKDSFGKVYQKIDDLPCHNPRWTKEKC